MGHRGALWRGLAGGALAVGLAGCETLGLGGFGSSSPEPVANVAPDSRGVITYASYQVAVARDGDTLDAVAARVGGVTGPELSRLNGLPLDYRLREGEVLALPDTVARGTAFGTGGTGWTPEIATQAIEGVPAAAPGGGQAGNPFGNGQTDPVIDPIRHRVEPGETAYSIARLYGVSVTALASWNGLGPDLGVRENQELLIPVVGSANRIQSGLPDTAPGQGTPTTPPPSASQPLPADIANAAGAVPDSPDLGQYQTPPGGRLARPVDGPITKEYSLAGPNRSEGIGFGVPAGTPVRAAGDGEVALISESLGDLGTIVIIRHRDDVMTVYGRVSNVTVDRGQQVSQGQNIGQVAGGPNPELHFEVRRGTESVDPVTYIGG